MQKGTIENVSELPATEEGPGELSSNGGTEDVEGLGETLIPAINKLQDIFSQVTLDFKLELPQVAVVGAQSSGKSSVLEALVGRDFLPRGPNICTRRPLVLQLVRISQYESDQKEYGEFLHNSGHRYYDFLDIRDEIEKETDRMTGSNKGISEKPIRLKICSPYVLTMTLVDLPGIARVPVGDQPTDIEARLRSMIYDYIRHPTCIVLAVSAANVDLANSDAISMAQSVDPEGLRTIGVLTKLDIMDRGTDASKILRNQVIPLRLGYIAVVNRSQADLNQKTSMKNARAAELGYFQGHQAYKDLLSHCGIDILRKRMSAILVEHIRRLLPGLKARISEAIDERNTELKSYGEAPAPNTSAARAPLLLKVLSEYSENFSSLVQGKTGHMSKSELSGGARIRHIFQDIYGKQINSLRPNKHISDEEIWCVIKNSAGVEGNLLIPQEPFEVLVRRAIQTLLPHALQCKDLVYDELLRIAGLCAPQDIRRFPNLQRELAVTVENFINQGAEPAERMIKDLIDCEDSFINMDHADFVGGSKAIQQVMESRARKMQALPEPEGAQQSNQLVSQSTVTEIKSSGGSIKQPTGLKGFSEELLTQPSPRRPLQYAQEPQNTQSSSWFSSFFTYKSEASVQESYDDDSGPSEPPQSARGKSGPSRDQEQIFVEVTRVLVNSYFSVVRRNMADLVPKVLMKFLVNHTKKGLQQHLITTMYREDLLEDMLKERDDIIKKRASCQQALKALREAMVALDSIPSQLSQQLGLSEQDSSVAMDTPAFHLYSSGNVAMRRISNSATGRSPSMSAAARAAANATAQIAGIRPASQVFGFEEVGGEEN